jgi:hypothetical protein
MPSREGSDHCLLKVVLPDNLPVEEWEETRHISAVPKIELKTSRYKEQVLTIQHNAWLQGRRSYYGRTACVILYHFHQTINHIIEWHPTQLKTAILCVSINQLKWIPSDEISVHIYYVMHPVMYVNSMVLAPSHNNTPTGYITKHTISSNKLKIRSYENHYA